MTVENLINRLAEYFWLLYHRRWERWELLAIAIAVLALLLLAGGARRQARANTRRLRERSPIIGIRLAGRSARR
ncbi:MAG: hypothetical protein PVJ86_09395 [Phycisphaerales bacterium]|jgi:hypothetical protein